ncbi:MAG: fumarylacetoacetate hydrolase family protein [Alphaproteobacteria bacterium]
MGNKNAENSSALPVDHEAATLVGRAWRPDVGGPSVVVVRGGEIIDITSREIPTMRDLLEQPDPAAVAGAARGQSLGEAVALLENAVSARRDPASPHIIAPVDLAAVKAAGVTFVASLLERVIEEQAGGVPEKAATIRGEIESLIGDDLSSLEPGSPTALALKKDLIAKGIWSQYLEVGIGPDPEIFTKCPVLASVGPGAEIGIHPMSQWNNPEPEIVLAVASDGRIVGATLGNDVNLRDVEGRSALLLGKAKDNNASCALGPFLRLFDDAFTLNDVRRAEVALTVTGDDGFELQGASSMAKISRDPEALVKAAISPHHQYPDGLVLFLGTMFAPTKDRGAPGQGFTHHLGDIVAIETPRLGRLVNRVRHTDQCAPWTFGIAALMRNLSARRYL